MKVEERDVKNLIPYARNPRNNAAAVDSVAASIKEFGFKQPIVVDKDNVVIVGHTRLLAAKKLGLDKVPVVVATDLTPEQVKAYRLADNALNEIAEWDRAGLLSELRGIEMEMGKFNLNIDDIQESTRGTVGEEWDFSPVKDEVLITIRCKLSLQAEVRQRLKGIYDDIEISQIQLN